jgi:Tfp pilus assembly protein PilV
MPTRSMAIRRGFSIIEATLAVLLIGTTLVAAMNVSVAASRASANANHHRQAQRLAQILMAEIMAQPASGANNTNAAGGTRLNNYDHVLDYEGLRQQPPTDMQGNALASANWAWGSNVAVRTAETVASRPLDLRMYHVTVFVELPDGGRVSLQALRSTSASLERVPFATTQQTVRVQATLTLRDGSAVHTAPLVRGQRPPEGSQPTVGVR